MRTDMAPVLIIGGSGIIGSRAAGILRDLHASLPIAIGGRDIAKAEIVAARIGNATAIEVDLERADLGQVPSAAYSAVVVFLKDETLNSARYAQSLGVPYVSLSSGTFEIGPEVALHISGPDRMPFVMASHWLGGAAVLPALLFARQFDEIEAIAVGALLDEQDMGGPAAHTDYERITGAAPAALTVEDGKFTWIAGEKAKGRYVGVDGIEVEAQAYSPFDIMSLATATGARSVRFDLAVGVSGARRAGRPFSTEIVIEIAGRRADGAEVRHRFEIVHPEGQAPLTALSIALAVERLLGLSGGSAVEPGLYLPEVLLDPAYFVRRMQEFGATFRHV
jgi:hypothetical protein